MTSLVHLCSSTKKAVDRFPRALPVIEAKRIDGKPAHRVQGMPQGAWLIAKSPIDAMLCRVEAQCGCTRTEICESLGIHAASITRCRQGVEPLRDEWILRMHDFSGIPVAELRQVACVAPVTRPYVKARRVA